MWKMILGIRLSRLNLWRSTLKKTILAPICWFSTLSVFGQSFLIYTLGCQYCGNQLCLVMPLPIIVPKDSSLCFFWKSMIKNDVEKQPLVLEGF